MRHYSRCIVSLIVMKHPGLGYKVRPNMFNVSGTSSLQGMAAFTTLQQIWH